MLSVQLTGGGARLVVVEEGRRVAGRRRERDRMFRAIWEYVVDPRQEADFLAAYGQDGPWVRLFRRHPGYLGTELARDAGDPRRFLTVDSWASRQAYRAFRASAGEEYAAIDAECARLTRRERLVGELEVVAPG
jgi:heme-degrading monooxygenase HmoA